MKSNYPLYNQIISGKYNIQYRNHVSSQKKSIRKIESFRTYKSLNAILVFQSYAHVITKKILQRSLTLEMRRGWCVSHPPCMRKPQGDPPKRVTSLALIPRQQPASRHPPTRASVFPAYTFYLRVPDISRIAPNSGRDDGPRRRRVQRSQIVVRCHTRDCHTRDCQNFLRNESGRVEAKNYRVVNDDVWTRWRPLTTNTTLNLARAQARDPHSTVARVGLTARVLPPPPSLFYARRSRNPRVYLPPPPQISYSRRPRGRVLSLRTASGNELTFVLYSRISRYLLLSLPQIFADYLTTHLIF